MERLEIVLARAAGLETLVESLEAVLLGTQGR